MAPTSTAMTLVFLMTTVRTTIMASETMGTSMVLPHPRPSEVATHLPLLHPQQSLQPPRTVGGRCPGPRFPVTTYASTGRRLRLHAR
ncbi:hypothetical protein F5148DRAFT_1242242 [Russula earlei]|uniref:Uncharacterized protein n=1 Tax=Russula earlei TaxID=71964 RepID=A0ACC0TVB6_9AGAM|nr:hypothetical protein F5148DRAFT_1242242 [Russula earlei]